LGGASMKIKKKLKISQVLNMTNAKYVHRIDIVKQNVGEKGMRRERIGKWTTFVVMMLMMSSSFLSVRASQSNPDTITPQLALLQTGVLHSQRVSMNANEQSFALTETNPLPITGVTVANPSIENGGGYYCAVHEYKESDSYDVGMARRPNGGGNWDYQGYFPAPDGAETIPAVDYWGSGRTFYATATYSDTTGFYYIKIPDIANPGNSYAQVLHFNTVPYHLNFYDSASVACYSGHNTLYAIIGSYDQPGYTCNHAPMFLYDDGGGYWDIKLSRLNNDIHYPKGISESKCILTYVTLLR